jgi:uncharacterized CHY-type Zn-finger protein
MPHWLLHCQNCNKDFEHTKINSQLASIPYDPLWPSKPDFAAGGEQIICPHCKETATYQRYQLIYSVEADGTSFGTNLPTTAR